MREESTPFNKYRKKEIVSEKKMPEVSHHEIEAQLHKNEFIRYMRDILTRPKRKQQNFASSTKKD
jgi:hypothetical protein